MPTQEDKVDMRINKIIIDTSAVIVSIFVTVGLVMSQVFEQGGGRFYELLGWSISLTLPFIGSTLLSVVVVAYHRELSFNLLKVLRHGSVLGYLFAWYWLILNISRWAPEWFVGNTVWCVFFFVLFVVIIMSIKLIYSQLRKKKVK